MAKKATATTKAKNSKTDGAPRVKPDANGQPMVDQGLVHGFPCTYNPDDGKFYLHAPGTTDGTSVLEAQANFRTVVQRARRLSLKASEPGR